MCTTAIPCGSGLVGGSVAHRLIAEYVLAFEGRDEHLLRSIWHDGARLDLGAAFGSYQGIDAIIESAHSNWATMPHMHHWMANAVIDIDGETAAGRVAVDCLCTHVEMGQVQISGLYHDRFEWRDGRWAFIERRFELHFLTPLAGWKAVAGPEASV
ncbi:nuclear transport factor 2 family protein [Pseudomonas sp. TH03]|uniref:nuclear transport factor 2 family protein n=1 Tax=Pseudomonas sp. TH03 TaxID=2796369 RepID=UPI001A937ADA|nr:nuclear transport factor 2 family protein [Pseudomonas sp. TH03]